MRNERLAYLLFVVVGYAYVGAAALVGLGNISRASVALTVVLVIWLGRGSRTAWHLFALVNTWTLGVTLFATMAAVIGQSDTRLIWSQIVTNTLGASLLLTILFSSAMRDWGKRPSTGSSGTPEQTGLRLSS